MNGAVCADTAALARVFRAPGAPSRIQLLDWLTGGPHSVGELAAASRQKQANVSKHLGILHAANLVRVTRQDNRMIYSIDPPWVASSSWFSRATHNKLEGGWELREVVL